MSLATQEHSVTDIGFTCKPILTRKKLIKLLKKDIKFSHLAMLTELGERTLVKILLGKKTNWSEDTVIEGAYSTLRAMTDNNAQKFAEKMANNVERKNLTIERASYAN